MSAESTRILEQSHLLDYIITDVFIFCQRCGASDTHRADDFTAIAKFYEDGWRVNMNECLCKECVEKLKTE